MKERSDKSVDKAAVDQRSFLSVALGTCAITPLGKRTPSNFAS
jgi:hypothetical protein